MVSLASLWLPVLLSAFLVFVASNVLHMVLKYHASDYKTLPSEDAVQQALRKFNIPHGDYMLPRPPKMAALRDPAFLEKRRLGPVAIITIMSSEFNMGALLAKWFGFCLVVSLFSGYLGSRALAPAESYLKVSQIVSCAAFMGYGLAMIPQSIWYQKSWATTAKQLVDALIYGFITGGTFGWLWPQIG
jgi:hypothetical protein